MPILFPDVRAVLQMHEDQIALYGGDASVRDQALLESAVMMPQAAFGGQWAHEFPHGMAAAYLFHLVSNHPFVDGNKRTGLATAIAFLELNGFRLASGKDETYVMVLDVAQGRMSKDAVIEFFRRNATR